MKLFKVTKWYIPEWGESQLEMEKYFLANSLETVDAVVRDRYGESHWTDYGESEVKITVTEIEAELL